MDKRRQMIFWSGCWARVLERSLFLLFGPSMLAPHVAAAVCLSVSIVGQVECAVYFYKRVSSFSPLPNHVPPLHTSSQVRRMPTSL
ncbi:MAG: hypothetical protein J3Q66DRAFT_179663 [Benniella sp.]|nr:MAG: hypothetical protein J3Q66DRAFT_179663 [Benniella sp.]